MEFRDALKHLRRELGITQAELAAALHIHVATVSRWELGRTLPNRSIAAMLKAYAGSGRASDACVESLCSAIDAVARDRILNAHDTLYTVEHESLSQLIEDAAFPVYVCDIETDKLLYVNHRAAALIGRSPENILGRRCYACLMQRSTPCPFCRKEELTEDKFSDNDATCAICGTTCRVQGKRIRWNGRSAQVRYITDMTQSKNASVLADAAGAAESSAPLAVHQNQIVEMMNTTPGGLAIIEVNPEDIPGTLRTTYYNDSFFSYSGYDREEYNALLQGNEMHFVLDEDLPVLMEAAARMCAGGIGNTADSTIRCRTKDGGYRWLLLTGQLAARREAICVIHVVLVDITERKEAEDKLRISEEMLRIAAETDNRDLITYNIKTNVCQVESRNLYSAKYGEILENVPQSLIDVGIIAPDSIPDLCAIFERMRAGEPKLRASLQLRTSASEYQWFECNATTVFDSDGQPDQAILVFHNITEQRIKEAVFRKWQQSISTRPDESYTLFRCNLSRDSSLDQRDGNLLKIVFDPAIVSFNTRTAAYAERYVYPEDREVYKALLNADSLLTMFYRGEHEATLEYREMGENGAFYWRLLTVEMVEYLNSTDVQAFLMYEDIDERKRAELKEKEMAETDPLTGVFNRAAFSLRVDALISNESGSQHALLMMDMDGFKLLNDRFGHTAGDQALVDVTAVIRSMVREEDLVCRLSGDEFLIWLRGIPYDAVIEKMAQQLCEQVRKTFSRNVPVSASIGVAVYPRDGHNFDELYHNADKALYKVKQAGKDNYAFFSVSGKAQAPLAMQRITNVRPIAKAKRRMLIVDGDPAARAAFEGLFKDEYVIEQAKNGNEAMMRLRHFGSAVSIVLLSLALPDMDGFDVLKRMQHSVELQALPVIAVSSGDDHKTLLRAIEYGAADYITTPVDEDLIRIRVRSAVSKAENERLRAQNSYLQLQRDEEIKFHTVLESTGTVVIEYNWRNHVFIYDNTISHYIYGNYDHRGLWAVFLSDMVADSADVKSLQELMLSLSTDRETSKASKLIMLKTPSKARHWFRVNVYKQEDAFGLAEKMIITFNDIHEEVLANEKLLFQATRDELTGLYNRSGFIDRAAEMVAKKEPGYYVLTCIDIGKFKVINDQYGTEKGDDVLRRFAKVMNDLYADADAVCCRVTADNFAAIYPKQMMDTPETAAALRRAEMLDSSLPPLKIYVGRYIIDDKALPISAAYDRAAMAKDTIKGRYDRYIATYDESMRTALLRQQRIIDQMKSALEAGEFEVWLQPQYNHGTGALSGAEALVRWRHPQDGIISPSEFIPIFERNGFVYELDKFVWEKSCALLRKWLDEGLTPVPVSVNISRYDVFRDDLIAVITSLVERYNLPVELLRLEITESAFVESAEQIIRVVRQFIDLGFIVEIDDFGSGYSSLNTLKDVPAQVLKMDMRFLEDDRNSQRGGNIIESVVRMAKWLGMAVIAEGVETMEQADYLLSIGCESVQGFLYAEPMPAGGYETLLAGSEKEPRLSGLKTLESWNNNAFWDPKSMETLVFNSYVGGACIFEYHNGATEILRRNKEYDEIFSGSFDCSHPSSGESPFNFLGAEDTSALSANTRRAIESKAATSCEVCLQARSGEQKYLRVTDRLIAQAGD